MWLIYTIRGAQTIVRAKILKLLGKGSGGCKGRLSKGAIFRRPAPSSRCVVWDTVDGSVPFGLGPGSLLTHQIT